MFGDRRHEAFEGGFHGRRFPSSSIAANRSRTCPLIRLKPLPRETISGFAFQGRYHRLGAQLMGLTARVQLG